MKKSIAFLVSLAALACAVAGCEPDDTTVTFGTLLREMTGQTLLSEYPEPAFTCGQAGSYDRRAVAPDEDGWFANQDYSWFLRQEVNRGRREFVLLDADGPGAVVRFWMAFENRAAYTGVLRFYIDGGELPAIQGPVLQILSGWRLAGAPLCSSVSRDAPWAQRGHNMYLPVPYAGHVKITYECGALDPQTRRPAVYYNINYRTYAPGTAVRSFSRLDLLTCKAALLEAQKKLRGSAADGAQQGQVHRMLDAGGMVLEPEETLRLRLSGLRAIAELTLCISADNQPQAYRSTILQVTFDGERTVWSPVGDFFGTGYQLRPYATYHSAALASGDLKSRWLMPFEEEAVVELVNLGGQPVEVHTAELRTVPYGWNSRSMHFGALWREFHGKQARGYQGDVVYGEHEDLTLASLAGAGLYVGDAVTVFNTAEGWWGEGDEKVYVDGETLPSHRGTGTEDYMGYAWARPERFEHFLLAQPDGSGNTQPGMTVNMRHRLLDAIPFTTSLRFDMELWHWYAAALNYGVVSYWYMKPGGACLIAPDPETVKLPVSVLP